MEKLLPFKALLLDLDGVITDTRDIHFRAWKNLFDEFLLSRKSKDVFTEQDYQHYLDGRPREDGIYAYLFARGLEVTKEEFIRLKTAKNEHYRKILQDSELKPFPDFLELMKSLKGRDIKVAVVSSSENARFILKKLDLESSFDLIFDGILGKRLNLRGKPEPHYFIEAARMLSLTPSECGIVEDALNGVMAGRKGEFHIVYGISRKGPEYMKELMDAGANRVITSLVEIVTPPNALKAWEEFLMSTGDKDIAIFLDFDGTLSEIVPEPDKAVLKDEAKPVLSDLSKSFTLAVVSGRDRMDVKNKVGLSDIFYAGTHGFDMSGPGCFRYQLDNISNKLKDLEKVTLSLEHLVSDLEGVIIEKKSYATAIHYRMASDEIGPLLKSRILSVIEEFPSLRIKEGKKVFEILPAVDWDKGKAVNKLIDILNVDTSQIVPIYIGDDTTDEDAFRSLRGRGIGIRVDDENNGQTYADFTLKNPDEVLDFLGHILKECSGDEKRWRCGT